MAVFVWIERQHIQATDRRLVAALIERDALIDDLHARRRDTDMRSEVRDRLIVEHLLQLGRAPATNTPRVLGEALA